MTRTGLLILNPEHHPLKNWVETALRCQKSSKFKARAQSVSQRASTEDNSVA
jgi:hypothetical protein